MSLVEKLAHGIGTLNAVLRSARWLNPPLEIVYRELLLRDLKCLGIEDVFYPVGSAANHGLLYAITRSFQEFLITSVLELGCGQSTLLLDALNRRQNEPISIRSVDEDETWADRVRASVSHEVVVAKLAPKTIRGHAIRHYGDGYFERTKAYDLIIVDGPIAPPRQDPLARLGCLEVIETSLASDFIVIVDDAERKGESILVDCMRAHFKQRGTPFGETSIIAAKRQHIFCGGKFQPATYF